MRVLLHNSETGLYYAGPNEWTGDAHSAIDFKDVPHAVAAYKRERVAFAEIVVDEGPSLFGARASLPDEPSAQEQPFP